MKAERGLKTASATFLTAALLFGAAPEAQATDYSKPNQNPANRLAKKYVKKIGGQILNMARRAEGDHAETAINAYGAVTVRVVINTGNSLVPGSNGKYTLDAFADDIGSNGLGRNDINNIYVKEGKSPSDGWPLFAARMLAPRPHGPYSGGAWHFVTGMTALPSGDRVEFAGTTYPPVHGEPRSSNLNREEVRSSGQLIEGIVDEALERQPTQLQDPPFGPVQRLP